MLFTSKQRHFSCFLARLNLCLLFTAIFTVIPCFAQEKISPKPELVTDRPDQTESSVVVPPGYVQVETGWSLSRDQEGGIRTSTHAFPGTLFRIGALDRMELRLDYGGALWEQTREAGAEHQLEWLRGYGSRCKTLLLGGTGLGFRRPLSWQEFLCLWGRNNFPVGEPTPPFGSVYRIRFPIVSLFGYNLGATWESTLDETNDRDTLSLFNYTAVLGIGLSERAGLFVEAFGDIPFNAQGGPRNSRMEGSPT